MGAGGNYGCRRQLLSKYCLAMGPNPKTVWQWATFRRISMGIYSPLACCCHVGMDILLIGPQRLQQR